MRRHHSKNAQKKRNKNRTRKSHGIGSLATGDLTDAEIQETLKKELDMMSQIKGVSHIATNKIFMKHDRPIKQRSSWLQEANPGRSGRQTSASQETNSYTDHGNNTANDGDTNNQGNDHGNNTANDGDINNQGNDHGDNTANDNNTNNQENDHGNKTATDDNNNNQGNDTANNGQRSTTPHAQDNNRNKKEQAG
ncbi:uncharacterized protein DDB_G0287625-like [Drosophila rhopaloa]|uniref:Uncharacterized protein n=1 Tax=Drosophila rhopaloa TaxID=1041015 RepID=A0ABM5JEX9_DRORH|nr:uncharacterized protein DDB_G0287625-like [Drosophila rhopaloa]